MTSAMKELKAAVSSLPEADFGDFADWFRRLRDKRAYQKRCDTTSGIPCKDLLKAFRKQYGNVPWGPWASMAASKILKFFETVRIQGCDPNDGEDVLMVEWGRASKG